MVNKIGNNNSIAILIVATSFGEIDWILPALKVFITKNENWRLVTVFGHKVVFDRFKQTNPKLFQEFAEISSLNIVPQELDLLFSGEVDPKKVKIILKDFNKDEFSPVKKEISDRCPDALLVNYPHSCHIYSNIENDSMSVCENPDAYSSHDIFLLGSTNDIPHWSSSVDTEKIRTVGYPRYDSWWVEQLTNDPNLKMTNEYKRAKKAEKTFFWAARGAHPHYLNQADYEYMVKTVADITLSYDNSFLLIKPHPRQDLNELFNLLSPYDSKRYAVSGLHLLQLSYLSDIVISGWSGGILDASAVGRPIIEFWRFGGRDPLCRKDSDGNWTTIYRELGLAAPADTKEELEILVKSALIEPKAPVWKSNADAFMKHCKFTDQSSQDIAKLLIDESRAKEAGPADMPLENVTELTGLEKQEDLIDRMIEYVSELVDEGQNEKAQMWLEFMSIQFPGNAKILNNLGVFLFNSGDVNKAIDRLVECLNMFPSFVEAAVNLIQMLLVVEKQDDALDVVISYFSKIEDKESKRIFLQALADQLTAEQFQFVHSAISNVR